jgi:hypothetical protein
MDRTINRARDDALARYEMLRHAAYAEALALRREAMLDFWRGADALLGHAAFSARRSAERLAQRLRRRLRAA